MTTPRTIDNFGGIFSDALPVEDPTTEQSAAYGNRLHEDAAQMTRTSDRAWVLFKTSTTGAPIAITVDDASSHAGTGAGQFPTISKTATGTYAITWASSFNDALSVSETVSFKLARGGVMSAAQAASISCVVSGNVVTAYVSTTLGAVTLSDLGGNIQLYVEAK